MSDSWILVLLAILGAIGSFLMAAKPRVVKGIALLTSGGTFLGLVVSGADSDPAITVLRCVVTITAFVAILGQERRTVGGISASILILLAWTLGVLSAAEPIRYVLLIGMMGTIGLLVAATGTEESRPLIRGGVVGWTIGILALAGLLVHVPLPAPLLHLLACAVLLPLFPLHAAVVTALRALPGTLPAFVVVALPVLGWHEVRTVLPDLSPTSLHGFIVLAVVGALLSAMRASVHGDLKRVTVSTGMILIALLWVQIGTTGEAGPATGWYISAVVLALSGLLLAVSFVQARYGTQNSDKVGGLGRTMPRLAVLVGVVVMAAAGLPMFGVFSGFWAMVVRMPITLGLAIALVLWLMATLSIVSLMQRVLFERPGPWAPSRDLVWTECVALLLIVIMLSITGMVYPREGALIEAGTWVVVERQEVIR